MTRERFEQLVEEALRQIPGRFRAAMQNLAVIVEDEPPEDDLFGLYEGTPLPERGAGYGNALPDRISIYQSPIEDACDNDDEIRSCVAETLIHEIGHYFGMTEEEIEHIEATYWRGRSTTTE